MHKKTLVTNLDSPRAFESSTTTTAVDYELAGDQYGVPSESGFLTLTFDYRGTGGRAELRAERGDILRIVGAKRHVEAAVKLLGFPDRPTNATDMAFVGWGIVLGGLVGIPAIVRISENRSARIPAALFAEVSDDAHPAVSASSR